ncbi:MAG TPA: class I SAM-dependent methyltransferase, partial [Patescibacteria group bacterium]
FFLSAKYHCKVIGIDYSKDAIDLASNHLKDFKHTQKQVDITFYNLDNDHLPDLSGVKYVFLNDVVEHLYDPELSQVFKKMYSWGDEVTLVVHTDNTIYLNYIRPFADIIGKYFGGYDRNYFVSRKVLEKLHVNLTNPRRLRNFLLPIGFRQTQLEYPQVAASAITGQLGLKPGTWLSHPIKFILNIFKPLSPSFYAAYKKS